MQGIDIVNRKIEVVRDWPKSQSVRDIQVFWGFVNFYQQFIHGFNWIVVLLTFILQTINGFAANKSISVDNINMVNGGIVIVDNNSQKFGTEFLILRAKLAFSNFRQAFSKTPTLHHFDPEYYIWIETYVSSYTIDGIFSQLTSNDLA